jgi:hypothetical protein
MKRELRPFWRDSTPEQALAAPDLIARHLEIVRQHAGYLARQYPREDVEPRIVYALYKAAYSFRPGTSSFKHWLHVKIAGELTGLKWLQDRKQRYGIHLETLHSGHMGVLL